MNYPHIRSETRGAHVSLPLFASYILRRRSGSFHIKNGAESLRWRGKNKIEYQYLFASVQNSLRSLELFKRLNERNITSDNDCHFTESMNVLRITLLGSNFL
jgi:hypothetical protein